jgi:predicted RNA binding protein YcfA (HicA-like mRNA interferase family)
MPNRLNNWTYKDVVKVLKKHNFILTHVRGSHYYYVGTVKMIMRQVCVALHGKESFKPRTLKSMILQSGLTEKEWGIE